MAVENQSIQNNHWLKKASRFSAWALLVSVAMLVVSGWGITQTGIIYDFTFGLIDRRMANSIHRATNIPLTIFFLTHVLTNIKLGISQRYRSLPWLTNTILIVIGIVLLAVMIYMEFFRLGG